MAAVRLAASIKRFLQWAEVNLAPATVACYRHYLARFLAWAGDILVASLTPATLTTWSRKYHPLQAVQRLTAWCHREERSIDSNPLERMRKAPTGKRLRTLTAAELARLLRGADACFRAVLLALRETFARPQEIRAVAPQHIRMAGGLPADVAALLSGRAFFELPHGKGFDRRRDQSAVRVIAISPRLGRLILRKLALGVRFDVPLFLDSRGRPWTANAVRCRLRRLRDRVGLQADARGERVVAYTFRHTGATAAARTGLRDFTLAEILGHASTRTTARYVHLQAVDVLDAMARVWEVKGHFARKSDRLGSLKTHPEDPRRLT